MLIYLAMKYYSAQITIMNIFNACCIFIYICKYYAMWPNFIYFSFVFIENGHNGVLKTLRDLQINDDDLAYAVEEYVKRKGIQLSYHYLLKDGLICGSWAFFIRIKQTSCRIF